MGKDIAAPKASAAGRFVEIDSLKAAGIAAVILIHSLRAPWDPGISSTERWLGIVTRFAVPAFLFCSGFLYATTTPVEVRTVLRRLRRVLIPYLVFSVAAQIWWAATGQGRTLDAIVSEILLGASFGPYYYIFVHFFLLLFASLFAVLPRFALAGLTAVMLLTQGWIESRTTPVLPVLWHLRSPLLWWGYFLLGWMIRLHHDTIRQWIGSRRGLLTTVLALAIVACTWYADSDIRNEWVRTAKWLDMYAILAFIFVVTCGRRSAPRFVGIVSDASFAIYLIHLFFIYTAQRFVQPVANEFDVLVVACYWSAGLFGALAVIAAARSLLGSRSRDVVGA